jgi:hypothetical protein
VGPWIRKKGPEVDLVYFNWGEGHRPEAVRCARPPLHPIADAFQNCLRSISAALKGLIALRYTLRLFVFEYAGAGRKGFVNTYPESISTKSNTIDHNAKAMNVGNGPFLELLTAFKGFPAQPWTYVSEIELWEIKTGRKECRVLKNM